MKRIKVNLASYKGLFTTWGRLIHQQSTITEALPPDKIPGPKSVPVIGTMYKFLPGGEFYNIKDLIKISRMKYQKYGSIVRQEYTPGRFITSLYEFDDFEKVYKTEGKYPIRQSMEFMNKYFKSRQKPATLSSRNGEDWWQARRIAQQPMMRPQNIATYIPAQAEVTDEFVKYLKNNKDSNTGEVQDCLNVIRMWAMEAVGLVGYSAKLGILSGPPNASLKEFMDANFQFFESIHKLIFGIPLYKYFDTKAYRQMEKKMDIIWKHTQKLIDDAVKKGKESDESRNILLQMIGRTDGSDKSIQKVASLSLSILTAGTDSTAISVTKCLYMLAKNPEVQERLYKEITRVAPEGQQLTPETLNDAPYLKAVVKETHRLFGAVPGNIRTLENDIVIRGYTIPAKEMISLEHRIACTDEKNFEEANTFKPERFLRENPSSKNINPYAVLPFGYGLRICVGKRIAEQEIYIGLIKILKAFRVEYDGEEIGEIQSVFTLPDRPVNLRFIDR